MANAGYYLLKSLTWVIQLFPLRVNFILSDILFAVVYYIAGYRKKVVLENLRNSFPEKRANEINLIARKFYQNFCDSFIETLYFDRISEKEIKKRVVFKNPELPNHYMAQGRQLAVLFGHYGNIEWLCSWPLHSEYEYEFDTIYKKLRNPTFERYYRQSRSRFGANPLEKAVSVRALLNNVKNNHPAFVTFLFDQCPKVHEIEHWMPFLNQDTPVQTGTEKVARKINAVSIYLHQRKIKRGYYEVEFYLIDENAAQTAHFELTEKMNRMLEKIIIEEPEHWLWSHKRWKHKRTQTVNS